MTSPLYEAHMAAAAPPALPHSRVLFMDCSSSLGLILQGYPWVVPLSDHIHCCPVGSSMATCGDLLCMMPMGCKGTACSTMGLPWAAGSPPSALTLGAAEPLLSHFSLPSPSFCSAAIFPFFNLFSRRCTKHLSCLSSAHWWIPFGTGGTGSEMTWDSFWALLTEATPAASTWMCKP